MDAPHSNPPPHRWIQAKSPRRCSAAPCPAAGRRGGRLSRLNSETAIPTSSSAPPTTTATAPGPPRSRRSAASASDGPVSAKPEQQRLPAQVSRPSTQGRCGSCPQRLPAQVSRPSTQGRCGSCPQRLPAGVPAFDAGQMRFVPAATPRAGVPAFDAGQMRFVPAATPRAGVPAFAGQMRFVPARRADAVRARSDSPRRCPGLPLTGAQSCEPAARRARPPGQRLRSGACGRPARRRVGSGRRLAAPSGGAIRVALGTAARRVGRPP